MKVLVADDHEFVRGGLVTELLGLLPTATFLQAGNAAETLECLQQNLDTDLAIIDLYMPGSNQYELIHLVRETYPKLQIVVLTASEDCKDLKALIACGVSAYIPKTLGKDIVNEAIQSVMSGDTYFPEYLLQKMESEADSLDTSLALEKSVDDLTSRQKEVLSLLLSGDSNKKIAQKLDVAENTVKIHVTAILKATNLSSRAHVIACVSESDIKVKK